MSATLRPRHQSRGDAPCAECGKPLGAAMVKRKQTVHRPECPKERVSVPVVATFATPETKPSNGADEPPPQPLRLMRRPTLEDRDRAYEQARQDPNSDWYGRNPDGSKPGESKNGHGENGQSTGRHLVVTSAADIAMKAIRWLWEYERHHWIPMGEITGLAGREGVGKSTWSAHIAARYQGRTAGGLHGKPKGVVIVTTEDDWNATVQPRLVAAGADLSKVYHVRALGVDGLEDTVSLPNDLAEFERVIKQYDVALVILDPLLTLINKKLDTHKDAEIRQALGPLTRVAHDTRTSFIGLIHVNKSTEGDLMNRVMGSRAIGAVVRAVLFCGTYKPVEEYGRGRPEVLLASVEARKRSRFVFGQIKNNLHAKVMESIEYRMEGQTVGYDDEAKKTSKVPPCSLTE